MCKPDSFWCPFCGRTTCDGAQCVAPSKVEDSVSVRDKAVKLERLPDVDPQDREVLARDVGSTATHGELEEFLVGYLGDEVFAKRFADCMTMIRVKNADYSQGEQKGDRIAAFRRISRDIDVPMTKVWAIFCQKHWGAIMRFVKEGQVESEPIDGRINDVINYMVLLGAIIGDEK